jgi:transcriptional regulator with XRE-family HTH domain
MLYTVFGVTNSAQILAQLLKAKGMTQGQAAIALGIRQQHISLYLSGKHTMSADRFLLFLEKLGGEVRMKG